MNTSIPLSKYWVAIAFSLSRFRTCDAYTAGVACVILVVEISPVPFPASFAASIIDATGFATSSFVTDMAPRSEEHTSELQSRGHLVCRLLLEKKKKKHNHAQKHATARN